MAETEGMMPCHEALDRLWDFIDGELPPLDEEAVRHHLEICNRCYPEYDFRRAYIDFARKIRERDRVRPETRRRLFQMILQQESAT